MSGKLFEEVAEIITRYSMLSAGDTVGVAVSGGADSVVLLQVLKRLSSRFDVSLVVLHVNHALRGAESEADQSFVEDLARSLELPFVCDRARIRPGNLEQEARESRKAFFARCRSDLKLNAIALGHTRSDQAETVLHRLLRGSGVTGLAAMRFTTAEGLIRPLLASSRTEIRSWAAEERIGWREDSSNANLDFVRNRLRIQTIPALTRDFNQNLEGILANTALLAQAEEDFWEEYIPGIYEASIEQTRLGIIFSLDSLTPLHLAAKRRLLRYALGKLRPAALRGLTFDHVESVLGVCNSREGHDRVVIPAADALRSFDSLLLSRPGTLAEQPRHYKLILTEERWQQLPFGAGEILVTRAKPDALLLCDNVKEDCEAGYTCAQLNGEILGRNGPLFARSWEPGDELHQVNRRSAEKVKSLFQRHRIRLWERRHWPVVTSGRDVVWVRDFGVSREYAPTGGVPAPVYLVYRQGTASEMLGTA